MNKTNFVEIGKQAFLNGESSNPYQNATYMALKATQPQLGGALKEAKAFAKGWHTANANAVVA